MGPAIDLAAVGKTVEGAALRRHARRGHTLDDPLAAAAILDELGDRTDLHIMPGSELQQLRDPRQVGPHSDVYSVAATVYCLLTGHPPFQHNNHFKLLQMIRDEMPPPLAEKRPELPRHLDEALTLALSKEPARRPKTVSALIDTLYPV